jgi:hypothetical protein
MTELPRSLILRKGLSPFFFRLGLLEELCIEKVRSGFSFEIIESFSFFRLFFVSLTLEISPLLEP